jgi:hypothetical protein
MSKSTIQGKVMVELARFGDLLIKLIDLVGLQLELRALHLQSRLMQSKCSLYCLSGSFYSGYFGDERLFNYLPELAMSHSPDLSLQRS